MMFCAEAGNDEEEEQFEVIMSAPEIATLHCSPDRRIPEALYSPNMWIRALLSDPAYDEPYALYCDPDQNKLLIGTLSDYGCIQSEWRPSRQMIDFDVDNATKQVLDATLCPAGPSTKPIIVTVRGYESGGKTRALLEIRQQLLLEHEGILPLAINFNTRIRLTKTTDPWEVDDAKLVCVLAVLTRLLQVFYGTEDEAELEVAYSEEIQTKHTMYIKSMLTLLDTVKVARENSYGDIIRYALLHMMRQLSAYRPVNTVVLLIDDAQRLENHIAIDLKRKDIPAGGVFSVIRNALLNRPIGKGVKSALVVSSVGLLPVGQENNPKRPVWHLALPARINVDDVVDTWWKMGNNRTEAERLVLKLLAATMCELPSLLCSAKRQYIERKRHKFIDDAFIKNVLQKVEHRWSITKALPVELLYSLIYGSPCPLEGDVVALLNSRSMISNVLTSFRESDCIIPECSLLVLKRAMEMGSADDAHNTLFLRRATCDCLRSVFAAIATVAPTKPINDPNIAHANNLLIEEAVDPYHAHFKKNFTLVLFYHWIYVRWLTALLIKEQLCNLQSRLDLYHNDPVAFFHSGFRMYVDTFRDDDSHKAQLVDRSRLTLARLLGIEDIRNTVAEVVAGGGGDIGDDGEEIKPSLSASLSSSSSSSASAAAAAAGTSNSNSSSSNSNSSSSNSSSRISHKHKSALPLPLPILQPSIQEALFDCQLADDAVVTVPGMRYLRTLLAETRDASMLYDDAPDIFLLLSLMTEREKERVVRMSKMPALEQQRIELVNMRTAAAGGSSRGSRKRAHDEDVFDCEETKVDEGQDGYHPPHQEIEDGRHQEGEDGYHHPRHQDVPPAPPMIPADTMANATARLNQQQQTQHDMPATPPVNPPEVPPVVHPVKSADAAAVAVPIAPPIFPPDLCIISTMIQKDQVVQDLSSGGDAESEYGYEYELCDDSEQSPFDHTASASAANNNSTTGGDTTVETNNSYKKKQRENGSSSTCSASGGGGGAGTSSKAIKWKVETTSRSFFLFIDTTSYRTTFEDISLTTTMFRRPDDDDDDGEYIHPLPPTSSSSPSSSSSSSSSSSVSTAASAILSAAGPLPAAISVCGGSSTVTGKNDDKGSPLCTDAHTPGGSGDTTDTPDTATVTTTADVHIYTLDQLPDHGERFLQTVEAVGDAVQFLYVYVCTRSDAPTGIVQYYPASNTHQQQHTVTATTDCGTNNGSGSCSSGKEAGGFNNNSGNKGGWWTQGKTQQGQQQQQQPSLSEELMVGGGCIVLGGDEVVKMLGPMAGLFQVAMGDK